jgi:hypothetical protein
VLQKCNRLVAAWDVPPADAAVAFSFSFSFSYSSAEVVRLLVNLSEPSASGSSSKPLKVSTRGEGASRTARI